MKKIWNEIKYDVICITIFLSLMLGIMFAGIGRVDIAIICWMCESIGIVYIALKNFL